MASKSDLLQGTLDLLILRTLARRARCTAGAFAQRIQQVSEDVLQVNQGSLYPALHRLEQQGLIAARVGRLRQQPPGEVLRAHARRPQAARTTKPATGSGWPARSPAS